MSRFLVAARSDDLPKRYAHIIEKMLTVYFDRSDLKLAKKRMKDLEKGRDTLINADDVWKNLGI